MKAERQEQRQECCRLFLWCLTFSIMLLATWSGIVYLIVRINNQAEDDPTDDFLALCPFMVLDFLLTYWCVRYLYYDEDMEHIKKRRPWMCVRLILVLTALSFTYLMPHLTPSESVLWIAVTVIHIPDCRKLLSWMNRCNLGELCLQPNVDYSHGPNCKCHVIQGMFTILVSIPHFATLFATFITFLPDKAINIPSLIIFIFLSSNMALYEEHVTLYKLCFGAITTLFPGLYPDRIRHNNDYNNCPSANFYHHGHWYDFRTFCIKHYSFYKFPYHFVWYFFRLVILCTFIIFGSSTVILTSNNEYIFWGVIVGLHFYEILSIFYILILFVTQY